MAEGFSFEQAKIGPTKTDSVERPPPVPPAPSAAPAPHPQGFSFADAGAPRVVERHGPSIGDKLAQPWKDYVTDSNAAFEKLRDSVFETHSADEDMPISPSIPITHRGLKTVGAATDLILSPVESFLGRPVESVTGIPRGLTRDVASLFIPIAPEAKLGSKLAEASRPVRAMIAPTTMSPEASDVANMIRRNTGLNDLEAERAAHKLVKFNKVVGNLPTQAQRDLVEFIENRTTRKPLKNKTLQSAADAIRDVYQGYRKHIEDVLTDGADGPKFIQDYYTHIWKETPKEVEDTLNRYFSRQGSGASLKKRTIPTIADGIAAGLTPRIENPLEVTMTYARNMSRFLATHQIQGELKDLGYAKWLTPGKQPKGWIELDGILTNKPMIKVVEKPDGGVTIPPRRLYAPSDVARIYNNFVSRGLEQGDWRPMWRGARSLANGMTMLKLGLSTFHLSTMAHEGIIGDVAKAFGELSRGKPISAAKTAIKAPAAPVRTALRGGRLGRELLDAKTPDAISQKVNDAFVRSGGRLRMDPFYRTKGAGSFFNAIERGTFKKELLDATNRIFGENDSVLDRAKGVVDMAGNLIQSVSAPLFEKYVPAMKRGAFAQRMEGFIRANPNASQQEIDRYAVKLQDSIDNRFGELVQDNLFWHRATKQIAQLVLLSPTWDIGTVREIGGGLADIPESAKGIMSGKGITDRTAYVAALLSTDMVLNGAMTYLHTGEMPTGMDWFAYRTGGVDPGSHRPERAFLPGYMKDVVAFTYNFPNNIEPEVVNKLNPALTAAIQLVNNRDYRNLPIHRPPGTTLPHQPNEPNVWDYLLDQMMPISLGQFGQGPKQGSKITPVEAALAVRPAPAHMTAPKETKEQQTAIANREWMKRIRADARQRSRYAHPGQTPTEVLRSLGLLQ
jgi:hypothetical protein